MPKPKGFSRSDEVSRYFREIKNFQPLSMEEERELFERVRRGDKEAVGLITEANLRFVVSVAKEFSSNSALLAEIISVGNVGLLVAVKNFDHSRGFKFITYAVWWIRQAILQFLNEQTRSVHVPVNRIYQARRLEKLYSLLSQELGREPTAGELAQRAELKKGDFLLAQIATAASMIISLDDPLPNSDDETLIDILSVEGTPPELIDPLDSGLLINRVKEILGAGSREYYILNRHLGLDGEKPLTLDQIGDRIGVTRERVRQLKEHALDKLRLRAYGLEKYKKELVGS